MRPIFLMAHKNDFARRLVEQGAEGGGDFLPLAESFRARCSTSLGLSGIAQWFPASLSRLDLVLKFEPGCDLDESLTAACKRVQEHCVALQKFSLWMDVTLLRTRCDTICALAGVLRCRTLRDVSIPLGLFTDSISATLGDLPNLHTLRLKARTRRLESRPSFSLLGANLEHKPGQYPALRRLRVRGSLEEATKVVRHLAAPDLQQIWVDVASLSYKDEIHDFTCTVAERCPSLRDFSVNVASLHPAETPAWVNLEALLAFAHLQFLAIGHPLPLPLTERMQRDWPRMDASVNLFSMSRKSGESWVLEIVERDGASASVPLASNEPLRATGPGA
ncbi:hypothetical protein PLICRDRAFT_171123 [Plicaturopsis crispa FD-325 SS-3]|nr:hypothetical protein PLICRDRAFT_171123 [Plicaturopsis crispa FD-325 SS-3]